ncbi:MAG: hypothetical protein R2712_12690 [Vicinamibacterales bacterium]
MIVPKPPLLRLPLGARKLVRLSRLKNSARNSTLPFGQGIATRFDATKSIDQKRGPRTLLRGALPNGWLGSVGMTTASRLR